MIGFELVTFEYFFLLFVVAVEEFVARVFQGGKVTVPKRLRELFEIENGDYVRVALVEVMKRSEGVWVRKRVGG